MPNSHFGRAGNQDAVGIFDASGHMAFINMSATLPKFASNNRTKGTPEENKAVVEGSYAYFGTCTVNEADRSFMVPDGMDQKRTFTLSGDELKYTNPVSTIGQGVVVEAVWKRAK